MPQLRSNLSRLIRRARRAHDDNELDKAERLYLAVLQGDPRCVDALHRLGMLNYQRGRLPAALSLLGEALRIDPRCADALSDRGLVLYAVGRFDEALASYEIAHRLQPGDPDLLNGQGVVLLQLHRLAEALSRFDRALALDPAHLDALGNRGNALLALNRPEEAIASYDAGLRMAPNHPRLLTNRAIALQRLDRPHEALRGVGQALASAPDFAEARFVESLVKLTLGDFRGGWTGYESRWGTGTFRPHRRTFAVPLWLGDRPLDGKTILLHAEQGYGDTIQFIRYAPLVAMLGGKVVVEAQRELVRLLSRMDGIEAVVPRGEPLPPFDLHCPLMSLPLALGTETSAIPVQVPYLAPPDDDVRMWRERLPAARPRIGLVWGGDKWHKNDANRSMRLETLQPLFDLRCFQFISLQQAICDEDARSLCQYPDLHLAGAPFRDFAETAAVISCLDAVVAVDTAVAHLAGAVGKPLLLLLPFAADFRWLRERQDSPWYPRARLFRQHRFNDWRGAVGRLCEELIRIHHRIEADRLPLSA